MAEIAIRPAVTADAEPLRQVIARAYAPYAGLLHDMPDVTAGLAEDIRDSRVWVALQTDQIVGGVVLVLGPEGAKLANLAVDPRSGGKGVGRTLIARAEEAARDGGRATLDLITHIGMTRTQAFYERLGWVETGRDGARVMMTKHL